MPTNTPIPTHAVGDVLSSPDWNTLPKLNTGVAMYGVGTTLAGSAPPTTAPNFLLQAGNPNGVTTTGLGLISVTFPNAFPNGLVAVTVTPNVVDSPAFMAFDGNPTASGFTCYVYNQTGSVVASTPIEFCWIAIGF